MRRALVTGVSRGIGKAVAEMLLADGWSVLGVSRTAPSKFMPRLHWWQWDVSGEIDPMLAADVSRHLSDAPLDAVIHCAAIRGPHGPLLENDPAEWVEAVNTNLLGTFRVVKATLPALQQSEDGRILLFSGGGAFNASPEYSAYATAKGGVVSLMETLAEELRASTVTVNAVAPGPIPTTIHGDNPLPDDGGAGMATAIACVRHLLSSHTRGLTGRTVSAVHDDWASISPATVHAVNASPMGTRTRHTIQQVARMRGVA